jgi:hypothetical protein
MKIKPNFMKSIYEIWITATAAILVPVILGVAGNCVARTIAERDLALRYIELAAEILRNEKNPDIRDWAVDIINRHSEVKMSGALKQAISGIGSTTEQGDKAQGRGFVH